MFVSVVSGCQTYPSISYVKNSMFRFNFNVKTSPVAPGPSEPPIGQGRCSQSSSGCLWGRKVIVHWFQSFYPMRPYSPLALFMKELKAASLNENAWTGFFIQASRECWSLGSGKKNLMIIYVLVSRCNILVILQLKFTLAGNRK